MKKMNGVKCWIRRNWLCLLLLCVVLVLAGNTIRLRLALKGNDQLVGTYNTVNGPQNGNGEYLVLQRDGTYCMYRQGEAISEQGDYRKQEEIIFLEGDGGSRSLVYNKIDSRIYDMRQGACDIFYKISDTPAFINVKETGM